MKPCNCLYAVCMADHLPDDCYCTFNYPCGDQDARRFEHVIPVGDLREHRCAPRCWCEPTEDGGVIIHNSLDEREKFERGERKPS